MYVFGCVHKALNCVPIKGSLDLSHFIFEMNVGKTRIRHRTTLKLNDEFSKPTFSDMDFKKCNGSGLDYP